MGRTRVSTTVDEHLLARARASNRDRAAERDAGYAAYDAVPLEAEDEWGDLASFREAAAAS